MPRITVVTNRCNGCGATHRPKPEDDDADKLDDGTEDTELPAFWVTGAFRAKQPNPDYHRNEKRVRKAVETQWPVAAQQAAAAKGGPLDSDDIEGLKELLASQARGTEEFPELTIEEAEAIWCPNCVSKLGFVGVPVVELSALRDKLPSAWVLAPAAQVVAPAPTAVVPPAVVPSIPQPPPLVVVGPAPAAVEPPPEAPRAA